jgi:CMP-N,N'-diacetyllegionaminic acid synthase
LKILSIIPARGGSKGIPLKNLIRLRGKSLLYYTVSASINSKINRTIVTTDDKKIASYAKKYGADVIMRPKSLASDSSQIEPAMIHVLDILKKNEGYVPDIIILLQNTSPLRTSKHIDRAIHLLKTKKSDSVFSGFLSHYLFWKLFQNKYIPINYDPKKRPNRQNMKNFVIENGAIFITKYLSFQKSKCRISGNIDVYIMPEESSIQIDRKSDLFMAEQILKGDKS